MKDGHLINDKKSLRSDKLDKNVNKIDSSEPGFSWEELN